MKNISVVFTGQGSQKVGMAQDFVAQYPESRKLFEDASEKIGINLIEICSVEDGRLDQTEYSQPALLTAEIAIYEVAKNNLEAAPQIFAGHSLGEYSAMVAAGVIPFLDAVQIVRKRGLLMQNAVTDGGAGMAALILDNIESIDYRSCVIDSGAEIANFNSPAQVVISGKKSTVSEACERLAKLSPEMRIVQLNVSTAFHSSLMKKIEPEFREYLCSFASGMKLENASKVLSNFTGSFHTPENVIDNLVQQISGSVRWTENMEVLKPLCSEVIEFGPARVLSKLCSTLGIEAKTVSDIRSMQKNLVKTAG